jgi:riboflavin kinase/FMN adenylyltransferase
MSNNSSSQPIGDSRSDGACLSVEARPIRARVVPGTRRGHALGFPTANLGLESLELPASGIYAVWVRIEGQSRWMKGAASVGYNPTFELRARKMEVHILDYTGGELYGKVLEVVLAAYLREERRYDGPEALIRQMEKDCANARRVLADCPAPARAPAARRPHGTGDERS